MSKTEKLLQECRDYIHHMSRKHDLLNWRDGRAIAERIDAHLAKREGMVEVPLEPTHAMLAALTQEWHPEKQGKIKKRYADMLRAAQEGK